MSLEGPIVQQPGVYDGYLHVGTAEFARRSNNLYRKIVAPLEPGIQGATKLYVIPDGKLALAPISALKDNLGHYVLEKRTIT
jgi:hypothetical protein